MPTSESRRPAEVTLKSGPLRCNSPKPNTGWQENNPVNECNGDVTPITLLSLPNMLLGAVMKIGVVVLVLTLSISHLATAQQITGSVCIPARADDPFWKEPPGQINSHGLWVKIDKRPAVAWPDRKSFKIDELDTSERHALRG